jgi:hypothetical protein
MLRRSFLQLVGLAGVGVLVDLEPPCPPRNPHCPPDPVPTTTTTTTSTSTTLPDPVPAGDGDLFHDSYGEV